VNAQGGECGNALHAALFNGYGVIVGLLLKKGAVMGEVMGVW